MASVRYVRKFFLEQGTLLSLFFSPCPLEYEKYKDVASCFLSSCHILTCSDRTGFLVVDIWS